MSSFTFNKQEALTPCLTHVRQYGCHVTRVVYMLFCLS